MYIKVKNGKDVLVVKKVPLKILKSLFNILKFIHLYHIEKENINSSHITKKY